MPVQTAPVTGHIEPEVLFFLIKVFIAFELQKPKHLMVVVSQLTKLHDGCARMAKSTQAKILWDKIKKVAQCAPVSPTVGSFVCMGK